MAQRMDMPKFIVNISKLGGKLFLWDSSSITIGRGDDCDLPLPDRLISREHATLVLEDGRTKLTDISSGNGISVNGFLTKEAILQTGDEVAIGKSKLVFIEDADSSHRAGELESMDTYNSTAVQAELKQMRKMRKQTSAKGGGVSGTFHLSPEQQKELGSGGGVARHIIDKEGNKTKLETQKISFGGKSADVEVGGLLVSRTVAEIEWNGIHHVLSKTSWMGNLTVNGEATKSHTLKPGDEFRIGESTYAYMSG
jgi:pSer/pThr/pTyr-binding forkhead associated (FHA) protein